MGNHIITFAYQTYNGEHSEPYNSKLKPTETEQTHKVRLACLLFLLAYGFVLSPFAFDWSNAMLALNGNFPILR